MERGLDVDLLHLLSELHAMLLIHTPNPNPNPNPNLK